MAIDFFFSLFDYFHPTLFDSLIFLHIYRSFFIVFCRFCRFVRYRIVKNERKIAPKKVLHTHTLRQEINDFHCCCCCCCFTHTREYKSHKFIVCCFRFRFQYVSFYFTVWCLMFDLFFFWTFYFDCRLVVWLLFFSGFWHQKKDGKIVYIWGFFFWFTSVFWENWLFFIHSFHSQTSCFFYNLWDKISRNIFGNGFSGNISQKNKWPEHNLDSNVKLDNDQ